MSDFRLSAIPYPRADVESLRTTTLALKEAVENLGGMRADDIGRSARYTELQSALSAIGLLRGASAAHQTAISVHGRVRVATTANITISTALNNADVLDGVTLVTGDRVLVKNQTTASENGVYYVGVSPIRVVDYYFWDDYPAAIVTVAQGTVNADTTWFCTSDSGGTLGTTAIVFTLISAARALPVSPTEYGAVGDGVADDSAAIQAAINAAFASGINLVFIPEGQYLIGGGTIINNPGVHVFGAGRGRTILTKSGLGDVFSTLHSTFTPTTRTLAANVVEDDRVITMTAGHASTFVVGEFCVLIDDGDIEGIANNINHGEFCTIQNITGDVITFWGPLRYAYTTANTAQLCHTSLLPGVAYSDMTVVMDDTITLGDNNTYQGAGAFHLRGCLRPNFNRIEITNAVLAAITLAGCYGASIIDYIAKDFGSATTGSGGPTSVDGKGGFGYCIAEHELNEGLIAQQLHFERCRTGYTTIGGYALVGLGVFGNYGEPLGSQISDGIHINPKEAGWDTHQAGRGITFSNLKTVGGRTGGFQIRSREAVVQDCVALDCAAHGIWIRGSVSTQNVRGNRCYVSNFKAIRTNQFDGYPSSANWTGIGAIVDDGIGTQIDGAYVEACGGPALSIGTFQSEVTQATYNNIKTLNPCQSAATNTYAVHLTNCAANADLRLDNFKCMSTDGKVTDVVYRAVVGKQIRINNLRSSGHTGALFSSVTDDGYTDASVYVTGSDFPSQHPPPRVTLFDEFLGNTLSTIWKTAKGSNATAALPVLITSTTGQVGLTTGVDAGGTMALNGSQLSSDINWRAANGGPLIFDVYVKMDVITNVAVYVGFTDQTAALEMPFTLAAGDVLTSNTSDGCGILFDTAADTDNWWLVGVKADVDATKQNTAVAPVAATFERWRVSINTTGVATFYRNGIKIGTTMTAAVTGTINLTPVIAAFSRAAASRVIKADWVMVEQRR